MSDRAGFLAVCADSLTEMCLYYAVAGILIMSGRGWGLHLFWLLLWAAVCAFFFARFLRKPRPTPLLTAATGGLVLGGFGLFALASNTPLSFGYGFVLTVGAGMAAGLPLYYTLKRPKVLSHLTQLDVLIGALLLLLLTKDALGIDGGTVALTVLVLFLDAAAAIGLRMTEDGSAAGGAFKASITALICAAALALVIGLLSLLFSRSGAVTGGLLHGIGAFFAAIGGGIERFLARLTTRFARRDTFDTLELDMDIPSAAALETAQEPMELSVNTTALGIVLVVVVLAAAVLAAVLLRKRRAVRTTVLAAAEAEEGVSRSGGTAGVLWQRLKAALAFRWTAFRCRDTAPGVLVTAERLARRRRVPRRVGESPRAFLTRLDPADGLADLADALDARFYGGAEAPLGKKRCRELRRRLRRAMRESAKTRTGGAA